MGRIVSLVPSLTEAIAESDRDVLVGATDWCTHPPDLDVVRLRGTKNPDISQLIALNPELVVANFEENRAEDLDALRAAGLEVVVTDIRSLPEAFDELRDMLRACGLDPEPPWWCRAKAAWADVLDEIPAPRATAVIPIWRRPWMVLGRQTFAGDLLARLGISNAYGDATDRYPRTTPEAMLTRDPDMVVLPDEPYAFGPADGPEAFARVPAYCVSGRALTWYGPSLVDARAQITMALSDPVGVAEPE